MTSTGGPVDLRPRMKFHAGLVVPSDRLGAVRSALRELRWWSHSRNMFSRNVILYSYFEWIWHINRFWRFIAGYDSVRVVLLIMTALLKVSSLLITST